MLYKKYTYPTHLQRILSYSLTPAHYTASSPSRRACLSLAPTLGVWIDRWQLVRMKKRRGDRQTALAAARSWEWGERGRGDGWSLERATRETASCITKLCTEHTVPAYWTSHRKGKETRQQPYRADLAH